MQSRIIDHGVLEQIEKRSWKKMEAELREAAQQLRKVYGIDFSLASVNEDYVLFRSDRDNEYLKARYNFTDRGTIRLESLERLVVSEASKKKARKEIIGKMVDGIADDDKEKANEAWAELVRRFPLSEMVKSKAGKGDVRGGDPAKADNADEENQASQGRARANKKGAVRGDEEMPAAGNAPKGELATLGAVDPSLEENASLLPNFTKIISRIIEAAKEVADEVLEDDVEKVKVTKKAKKHEEPDGDEGDDDEGDFGGKSDEDGDEGEGDEDGDEPEEKKEKKSKKAKKDDKDDVEAIEIDTTEKAKDAEKQNEACKCRRNKIAEARGAFAKACKGEKFKDRIKKIKGLNNTNDEEGLSEALSDLVVTTPSLVYVSREELVGVIRDIFESDKVDNWNAELCEDIAFGLRKLAYNTHVDRSFDVVRGAALDGVVSLDEEVSDDDYEAFENVSSRFFENIYEKRAKQVKALNDLSETLAVAANILESDVEAAGLDRKVAAKTVLEFRQFASKMRAQAYKGINESVVKMVVGSLLQKHANDYSLNSQATLSDPGHFRGPIDLDQDYEKHAGKNRSEFKKGDDGMSLSNPLAPKGKGPGELDLDKGGDAAKDFSVMQHGIHDNPLAPKAKGPGELDLS